METEEGNNSGSRHSTVVQLDVGGIHYKTTVMTFTRFPDSLLGRMFARDWENAENQEDPLFIDRDGEIFKYILSYLQSGVNAVLPPEPEKLRSIKIEADYYQLNGLVNKIDLVFAFNPFAFGDKVRLKEGFEPLVRGLERTRYIDSMPTDVEICFIEHCTGCRAMWDVKSEVPNHEAVPLRAPEIQNWPCHACNGTRNPLWMQGGLIANLLDTQEIYKATGRVYGVEGPCLDVQWILPKSSYHGDVPYITLSHHVYAHLVEFAS